MYPFWDLVVFPALVATDARRIVEIGALRGDTTVRLIRDLGEGTQLHVIDPVPDFDPHQHEERFPGQYVFHRALSLDVLDDLPAMDAALIDGDHNYYTVIEECRALGRVARAAGQRVPVMLFHDVCWPYGRRDLYYDPSNIPPEHLQPHRLAGISRATDELKDDGGGFNKTLHNAVAPDGPRNGVMTAVEDFIEEWDRPLRMIVLPIYFGLAIVADEETLAEKPELRAIFDRLESPEGKDELLELGESIRLDAVNVEQNFYFEHGRRIELLSQRYMDLVKKAVVNDLRPEQEMRIRHLLDTAESGSEPSTTYLHDPIRSDRPGTEALTRRHRNGSTGGDYGPLTPVGSVAVEQLHGWLQDLADSGTRGDLVDCGTGWGGIGLLMRAHVETAFLPGPTVWVCDRFSSADDGDLNTVRETFDRFGLLDDRVRFLGGPVHETVPSSSMKKLVMAHVGAVPIDELDSTLSVLHRKLALGGRLVVSTGGDPDREAAVDRLAEAVGVDVERPGAGTRTFCKVDDARPPAPPRASSPPATAPLMDGAAPTKDLTMVVVFWNMKREAERTLRSLSRSYQEGIADLDYEVLVVDNGSDPDQRLDRAFVESFGPEFVLHDLADSATPSPTTALNHGIAHARGEAVGLMIDGAHLLSPGVLREAMIGLRGYAPAAVAVQIFYLGPGQQSEVMAEGYDQATEDRLMEAIEWPTDGYKLFDIAHFQGDRDWLAGMWESNCLFVPHTTLRQIGGFDDSFDEAGGGYANLEIFERVGASPELTLVTLLGEASFHQVHGGITNNQPSPEQRFERIQAYEKRFEELRGREFHGPRKIIHYAGSVRPNTRRSRARRMAARRFFKRGRPGDPEGLPPTPVSIPDELAEDYLEAYWANKAFERTSWLGHPVRSTPDDLLAYQQLVVNDRPEWIIVTGSDGPGLALYLASVCELNDHGRVVFVDVGSDEHEPPTHDRLVSLRGDAVHGAAVIERLGEVVPQGSAMVIIGSGAYRDPVVAAFDALAPFVAQEHHAVIEWTALNGNPVWPSYGPGPHEAARLIRRSHREFIEDPTVETPGLSFHRGGFLKKVNPS